jgi:hypothetical protein
LIFQSAFSKRRVQTETVVCESQPRDPSTRPTCERGRERVHWALWYPIQSSGIMVTGLLKSSRWPTRLAWFRYRAIQIKPSRTKQASARSSLGPLQVQIPLLVCCHPNTSGATARAAERRSRSSDMFVDAIIRSGGDLTVEDPARHRCCGECECWGPSGSGRCQGASTDPSQRVGHGGNSAQLRERVGHSAARAERRPDRGGVAERHHL